MSAAPLFTSFADAPRETADGAEIATLLAPSQSDGRSHVAEIRCPARQTVSTIGDARQHRYIHVLEGDWTMVVGGETHAVAAGATLVAPRGAACGGSTSAAGPGRLLVLAFPG